jgi:hypothetical protein
MNQGTIVNKLNFNVIALAVGLASCTGVMAQNMSNDDYKAGQDKIAAAYKSAKAGCASFSGNTHDICMAQAQGRAKVASAELDASYKPSTKTRYQARVVKAEADYAVAKERCDDVAGNAKDVCVKEAEAAQTAAKADAKAQTKVTEANATADEKSAEARGKANDQAADARKEASQDKIDAQYGVAKQQCDTYAGGAKDQCLDQAKARFGK